MNPDSIPSDSPAPEIESAFDLLGMTLRDHFAGRALAALITTQASWRDLDLTPVSGKSDKQLYAMFAYQFADAMVEARGAA